MKLRYYFRILLWCIFSPHKAKYYYYRVERCGMIPFVAFEQAKYLTKEQFKKMEKTWEI